jgi:GNAT superfamily N-acetyltransferase
VSRERAIALHHARQASICDVITPWEHGTAVRATDLATFYDFNDIRVEGPDAGLAVADLVAAADRLLAGLRHRQIEVEDEGAGRRLRPDFERRGWDADRLVWMALEGAPRVVGGAGGPVVEIAEVPVERTRSLREAWFLSDPRESPDAWRRFIRLEEIVAARRGSRSLIAWGAGGEALGYTSYWAGAGVAEVEQVFVAEAHRGRGIGGALVTAAVDAARAAAETAGVAETAGAAGSAPMTRFIVADDEEDAKRLYARLGFAPVWIQHTFTLRGAE